MRSIKGLFVGVVLAGILALAPAAAFAHGGGGGGGHGGGGGGFCGGPFGYDYPYYGYDYPYYDYYGDYSDGQYSPTEVTPSQETIIAVQKELTQLGYYHGHVDGLIGPQMEGAIRWFQSVNKLAVTGQIDDSILKALRIS